MGTRPPLIWLPAVADGPLPDQTLPAELYHESSKYHRALMYRLGPQPGPELRAALPACLQALPPAEEVTIPLSTALGRRRSQRAYADRPVAVQQLATLLGRACSPGSYPSAGARYPIEVCLLARRVTGIAAGFYRYRPEHHGLQAMEGAAEALLAALLLPGKRSDIEAAPLSLILISHFPRMTGKYGARGYRFCLQECGHIGQNVQLLAVALGLDSLVMGAFLDDEVHAALGLDGVESAVLAVMPVGYAAAEKEYQHG